MNREMLKECIADAKTIRETAIASAKLALEEAFTPTLMASFAEQLNELEEEVEMEEGVEETYSQEGELEENFDLEELLAELSMEEEQEPKMEGKDMKEPVDENLMLEEMSDEEIEELVMQVIDDMIASGKLMPGEGEEDMEDMEDMDGEEEVEDEEIDIDEILSEADSEEAKEEKSVKEQYVPTGEEAQMLGDALTAGQWGVAIGIVLAIIAGSAWSSLDEKARAGYIEKAKGIVKKPLEFAKYVAKAIELAKKKLTSETEVANAEMEETINELRNELNEVNLLNAKLLYTNKIFKAKNLTESEKIKVLNTFDKAGTVREVKLVFETLTESLKTTTVKKNSIKESLGSASKTISTATPKQPIIESNEAFARMQRLAGLKK
jgi:hypothetical protein